MKRVVGAIISGFLVTASVLLPITPAQAATGDSDTALVLSGSSQYASAADSSALKSMNAISIEFWFKSSAATCTGNIVTKDTDYAIYCTGGNLAYAFRSAGSGAIGTEVKYPATTKVYYLKPPQDEWHHFAITRAASTNLVTTYWDGQVVSDNQVADGAGNSALRQTSAALNIGARNNSATYFPGVIDEVRISNVVRTKAEIQRNMNNWGTGGQSGVVAYYDFNDISGSTVIDRVNGQNLTLTGSPSNTTVETTTDSNGDKIISFPRSYLNSNGGWKVPSGITKIQSLVVGGGGAGGSRAGGGGGAGGYVATDANTLTFTPGTFESITVGVGGIGNAYAQGLNGTNSVFDARTALGGGGGGGAIGGGNSLRVGKDGGSGGAPSGADGSGLNGTNSAALGTSIQASTYGYGVGFISSYARDTPSWPGGGGGGAGGAGVIAPNALAGSFAVGGAGLSNTISATATCYATGGGGGGGVASAGTSGFGGNGGDCGVANVNNGRGTYGKIAGNWGKANTGAGGGGSGWDDGVSGTDAPGGHGGSGVVILRYSQLLSTTFTGVSTANYRQVSVLSVSASFDSKVTFYANGKRIAGCISVRTVNLVANCNWRPSLRGNVKISATTRPINSNISSVTDTGSTYVSKRVATRS